MERCWMRKETSSLYGAYTNQTRPSSSTCETAAPECVFVYKCVCACVCVISERFYSNTIIHINFSFFHSLAYFSLSLSLSLSRQFTHPSPHQLADHEGTRTRACTELLQSQSFGISSFGFHLLRASGLLCTHFSKLARVASHRSLAEFNTVFRNILTNKEQRIDQSSKHQNKFVFGRSPYYLVL